jgi:hypothetical protein
MRRPIRDCFTISLLYLSSSLGAQATPPARDTVKRDSLRATTLAPITSEATRIERQIFDQGPNVGHLSVGGKELSVAPRFFSEADLLRAVQLLPGVEAKNDFSAGMSVRGGESDQNLVLLDGYPLYNPFHLGGLFGTFIDPMVGRVDLFTGAYPAVYGNRLSSVLDVRSAEETRPGIHGSANVSLIASTISFGKTRDDGRDSWMIGARRTYIDKMVSTLTLGRHKLPYDFRDLQAHVRHEFSNGIRVQATGYSGHDLMDYHDTGDHELVTWGNGLLGATIGKSLIGGFDGNSRFLGDSVVVEQRISNSSSNAEINVGGGEFQMSTPVRDLQVNGLMARFTAGHTRTLGYQVARQRFRYSTNQNFLLLPADSQAQHMLTASAYYDDLWHVSSSLMLTGGLRFDVISGLGWHKVTPRLSAKYFVTPDLAITLGAGEYAQWVRSLQREEIPIRPIDLWVGSGNQWPVSTARHLVLGAEGWINRNRGFRVEAFYKKYQSLLEPNPADDAQRTDDDFDFLRGRSYGLDMMLRQFSTGGFSGWVAYTFAVSQRTMADGTNFCPAQDRRHDLNAVGGWEYPKYTLNARLNYASGLPYQNVVGDWDRMAYDPIAQNYEGRNDGATQFLVDGRNTGRLPATVRVDLNVTRKGHIGHTSVSPYLSVVNALNLKNALLLINDYGKSPPTQVTVTQLPLIPTLGVAISW